MKRIIYASILIALAVSGCKEGGFWSKTPIPEQPGPKTKEEFLALFKPMIQPLRQALPEKPDPAHMGLADGQRDQVIKSLSEAKTKYAENEAAEEAFREIGAEVSDLAKRARDQGRWPLAMACIDAHEILGMQSYALERLRKQGKIILAQPKVRVQGFMEDKQSGVTTVFIELTNRETGKITRVAKRAGDEFNGLRLVEILEHENGVRFEYLPIEGMFFDVEGPHRK